MVFEYYLFTFIGIVLLNIIFFIIYGRFGFSKNESLQSTSEPPISVLVYCKNQAESLKEFIPKLINQNYSNYEIVIVSNHSYDDTIEVFESFEENHDHIKLVDVENNEAFWGSKKYALTLGVRKAKNNFLLFTSPEVEIIDENWIKSHAFHFANGVENIFGYTNKVKAKGLSSLIIRFCNFMSSLNQIGLGSIIKPFKTNEYNFGYTKELFFENNGYTNQVLVPKENNNLLLSKNITTKNSRYIVNNESMVFSKTIKFKDWFYKKRKNYIAQKKYPFSVKLILFLFFTTEILFWTTAITGGILFKHPFWFIVIGIRFLIVGIILGKCAFKLKDKNLLYFFPFLELINIWIQLIIFTSNLISKPKY